MRSSTWLPAMGVMLTLSACALPPADPLADRDPFVRGEARVVSVDQLLGQAVLDFQGRRVYAYWQTESHLAQAGAMVRPDPLKPPVGQYREPVVQPQTFDARPGDRINFVGMRTGQEILLRSVSVIAP